MHFEFFSYLKNAIRPSCQIKLVHEMTPGQDSHYSRLALLLETSLSIHTVLQTLHVCMIISWLSASKNSNSVLHDLVPNNSQEGNYDVCTLQVCSKSL